MGLRKFCASFELPHNMTWAADATCGVGGRYAVPPDFDRFCALHQPFADAADGRAQCQLFLQRLALSSRPEPAVLCVPSCSVAPASDEISGILSMPDGTRAAGPHWQRQRWQSDGGSSESSDWIIHVASSSRSSSDWQQILSHIVKLRRPEEQSRGSRRRCY